LLDAAAVDFPDDSCSALAGRAGSEPGRRPPRRSVPKPLAPPIPTPT